MLQGILILKNILVLKEIRTPHSNSVKMKSILLSLLLISSLFACTTPEAEKPLPRIAIAGLAIESSTFSPALTQEEAFKARVDEDVFTFYPFLAADSADRKRAVWIPTLRAHALPGGTVTREAYESLVNQTLERLKANLPYDGLFFDIHGAMSVVGLDDPEGDGLTAPGFEMGNSPVAYLAGDFAGRKLAMTTTNGTQAIHKSAGAFEILIGAFPNLSATTRYIQSLEKDVLIHCAGWKGRFNLEDSLYAGALVKALEKTHSPDEDGALAMLALFEKEGNDLKGFLSQASHAKRLQNHHIEADIDFCLTLDLYDLVLKMDARGFLVKA